MRQRYRAKSSKPKQTLEEARIKNAKKAREFISRQAPTKQNLTRKVSNSKSAIVGKKFKQTGRGDGAAETATRKTAMADVKRVKAATKARTTDAKRYTVGKSKGGVSFKEAFAYHRKKGAKTFTWNGKKYSTKVK